jgi:hypothetical protein
MRGKYQPDSEIQELINLYLSGDARAGGKLLNQYDDMIAYYIKGFFTTHDLWVGWDCKDVAQMAKLHILQYLKNYKMKYCPFPHYIKISTYRACQRYMRFISSEMRDVEREIVYDVQLGQTVVDWTVKNPLDVMIGRELFSIVQAAINQLDEVCQQIYRGMLDGQPIYGKNNNEFKRIPEWIRLASVRKIREVVSGVLVNYNNPTQQA